MRKWRLKNLSKYTTEIRFICENASGLVDSVGYKSVNEVIEKAIPKVFDFPYPIFDEAYKPILEKKILKHYYTREIAFETVGLFKLKLDTMLNEIMPYYNQLYNSELLEFNPLYDVDVTRTHEKEATGTANNTGTLNANGTAESEATSISNTTGSTTGKFDGNTTGTTGGTNTSTDTVTSGNTQTGSGSNLDAFSDTPQGAVGNLETYDYLTNARKVVNSNTIENASNSSNTTNGSTTGSSTNIVDDSSSGTSESDTTATDTSTNTTSNTANTTSNTQTTSLEDYIEKVSGKQGSQSYSSMLQDFRQTFLNIDKLIIEELSDLFFNLW